MITTYNRKDNFRSEHAIEGTVELTQIGFTVMHVAQGGHIITEAQKAKVN